MGDSPSLSYMPQVGSSYDQDIFDNFTTLAYLLLFSSQMELLNFQQWLQQRSTSDAMFEER